MAYEYYGARIIRQSLAQGLDRIEIQMVGRFIQNQSIKFAQTYSGQTQARPFTARKYGNRLFQIILGKQKITGHAQQIFRQGLT